MSINIRPFRSGGWEVDIVITSRHTKHLICRNHLIPHFGVGRLLAQDGEQRLDGAQHGAFCSKLAMTGAHVMEIKTLAGHAELETTQRYMHLTPRALRGAVDRLEGRPCEKLETTRRRRSAPRRNPSDLG